MKRRPIGLLIGLVGLVLMAAACGGSSDSTEGGIVLIEDEPTPNAAQTAAAPADAATLPPRTPVPTGDPFVLPTLAPDLDPAMPITRVGSETITLEEYQKQVRFERFARLYVLGKTAERRGTEVVLDLTKPENQNVASLFATLADSYSFGRQVQRVMVIDAIALQEATRQNIEVDPAQFDARLAQYLNKQVGAGGAMPEGWDADYAEFLAALKQFTGMNEEEFLRIVRARVLYSELKFKISNSPEANPPAGVAYVGVEVEDMIVPDYDDSVAIASRLNAGEALSVVMLSLGYQPAGENTSRVVRFSDQSLSADVITALGRAQANEVVGPFPVTQGWYVGRVLRPVMDALSPTDIDALRERYFLDWIEAMMDDPAYVEDFDNWILHTPQEPLPQDVSPLLRDEYVIVPEGQEDTISGMFEAGRDAPETPEATPASTE